MFALSDDSTNDDHASSAGNLDVEWSRAMNDLRRQEEEDMIRGTFSEYSFQPLQFPERHCRELISHLDFRLDFGFQPIEQKEADEQHDVIAPDVSDWKSRITGGLGI